MDKNKIFNEIKNIIKKHTNSKIEMTSNIKELGLDSLDLMDLVLEAEDKYNIMISDDNLMSIKTINDLVDIVYSLLK